MTADETNGRVQVLPDYSNGPVWMMLTRQMMRGHITHINREINNVCRSDMKKPYFSGLIAYAKTQKEFWETIEQIGTVCLSEMEKEQTKLQE